MVLYVALYCNFLFNDTATTKIYPYFTTLSLHDALPCSLRRDEHRQMKNFVGVTFGAHMGFLIGALDGDPGDVAQPALPPLPTDVNEALVRDAIAFLRDRKSTRLNSSH